MKGLFVTFEGVDGAGKTTQLRALADRLRAAGHDPLVTREPGGSPLGAALRELVLKEPMTVEAELLLYVADRAEHLRAVVWPALQAGRVVLCDRHIDSTWAYQRAAGANAAVIEDLERISTLGRKPDRTVLLDVPKAHGGLGQADRIEQRGSAYLEAVRRYYLQRAAEETARFIVVDGSQAVQLVSEAIWQALQPTFGQGGYI